MRTHINTCATIFTAKFCIRLTSQRFYVEVSREKEKKKDDKQTGKWWNEREWKVTSVINIVFCSTKYTPSYGSVDSQKMKIRIKYIFIINKTGFIRLRRWCTKWWCWKINLLIHLYLLNNMFSQYSYFESWTIHCFSTYVSCFSISGKRLISACRVGLCALLALNPLTTVQLIRAINTVWVRITAPADINTSLTIRTMEFWVRFTGQRF